MPILDSVAANVESTLAYTISARVVDIIRRVAKGGVNDASRLLMTSDASPSSINRDSQQGQGTIMMCTLLLTLAIASELSPISKQIGKFVKKASEKAAAAAAEDGGA